MSSSSDVGNVVLDYFHQHIQQHTPFPTFLSILTTVFSQDENKIKALSVAHPELRKILAVIAAAIQDVIIATPPRYYFGIEPVPDTIKTTLKGILNAIDSLRKQYNLPAPVRDHSTALRDLNVQIARADQYVWLPFGSLVTAPLATKEDLNLYARNTQDAEQLARLIIKGDGVFLITGYRGVGKSTFISEALSMLPAFEEKEKEHDSQPWRTIPNQTRFHLR